MAEQSVIEAVRDAMREEMRRDERVFVMGEDIGARGGVFLATEGFVEEFGEATGHRYAPGRVVHRGHRSGRGDARNEADRRDRIRRFHLAHHQSDGGRSCQSAIWHQRQAERPDGAPRAHRAAASAALYTTPRASRRSSLTRRDSRSSLRPLHTMRRVCSRAPSAATIR